MARNMERLKDSAESAVTELYDAWLAADADAREQRVLANKLSEDLEEANGVIKDLEERVALLDALEARVAEMERAEVERAQEKVS